MDESLRDMMDRTVREIILDESFWDKAVAFLKFFKPLVTAIYLIECDESRLSFIPKLFVELRQFFSEENFFPLLLESNHAQLLEIINHRAEFCMQPIHYLAHLLDPRFMGECLTVVQENQAKELFIR